MTKEELKNRWVSILRIKASEYEHKARKAGETVSGPSLDDICNEIEAFFVGLGVEPKKVKLAKEQDNSQTTSFECFEEFCIRTGHRPYGAQGLCGTKNRSLSSF